MIRRLFRLVLLAGAAAGVVAALRALTSTKDPLPTPAAPSTEPWPPLPSEPAPAPVPPTPTPTPTPAPVPTVVPEPDGVPVGGASSAEPTSAGDCPDGFPIKANLKSKIFHSPGQLNYDRTMPDRCYTDAAAAEADGLRAAKR